MSIDVHSRHEEVRNRLSELRKRRTEIRGLKDSLTEAYSQQEQGENPFDSPTFQRIGQAQKDLTAVETEIELGEQEQATILSLMADGQTDLLNGGGESFFSDRERLGQLQQLGRSAAQFGDTGWLPYMNRDQYIESLTRRSGIMAAAPDVDTTAGSRTSYFGIVPMVRRPTTLLDLIPVAPMEVGTLDLAVESSPTDFAAETVEGSAKPAATQTLTDVTVRARTIANYEKMKRQQLADVPALGSFVKTALIGGVNRRLQAQILAGDGVGENLTGITNTAGIGAPASVAGDNTADTALNLVTSVRNADGDPSAVVLNPTDWQKIRKQKAATSGDRMDGNLLGTVEHNIDGVPVIFSTAVSAGFGLCADFAASMTLFIREGVNIRFSDADQDDFIKNKVTALAEGRYGFIVWRPTLVAYKALV